MKRLLALLLVMLMVLSLVACANDDKPNSTPDVTESNVADEADASDTTTSAQEEPVTTTTEQTTVATTTTEATTEAELPAVNLTRGKVDGNVYSSDYSGLIFTKPADWVYATDEGLNETMNLGSEAMELSEFQKAVANLLTVSDMSAQDPYYGSSVSVSYENIMLSGNSDMTEEEYLDSAKLLMAAIEEPSYTFGDTSSVELSGREFVRLDCIVTYLGVEIRQYMYVSKIDNNYMALVYITLINDADVSEYEARFNKDFVEPAVTEPEEDEKETKSESDNTVSDTDIVRGTVSNNVYTSEFMSLVFAPSSEWRYASDEDLNGYTTEEIEEYFDELYYFYDAEAYNYFTGDYVDICLENLVLNDISDWTIEDYAADIVSYMTNDESVAEGYIYEYDELEYVTFAGSEFAKLTAHATFDGGSAVQVTYLKRVGDFMCDITITVYDENDLETIESYFHAIGEDYVIPETTAADIPVRGTITETTYTHEILGFKFAPEGWVFASAEEEFGYSEEDVLSTWEDYYYVDDVCGTNYDILAELYVVVQYVGNGYTEEEFLEFYKESLLAETDSSIDYEMSDYKTIRLGNTEFTKFDYKMDVLGETWTISYYAAIKDEMLYCININVLSNTDISTIESQFVPI